MLEKGQPHCDHKETSNAKDGSVERQKDPGSQEVTTPALGILPPGFSLQEKSKFINSFEALCAGFCH